MVQASIFSILYKINKLKTKKAQEIYLHIFLQNAGSYFSPPTYFMFLLLLTLLLKAIRFKKARLTPLCFLSSFLTKILDQFSLRKAFKNESERQRKSDFC